MKSSRIILVIIIAAALFIILPRLLNLHNSDRGRISHTTTANGKKNKENSGSGAAILSINDIQKKVYSRKEHIFSIDLKEHEGIIRFTGVHHIIALRNIRLHGKPAIGYNAEIQAKHTNGSGLYEAKVVVHTPEGKLIYKSGNRGYSTFFPDDWNEDKVLQEVIYAISHNVGPIDSRDPLKGYYGFTNEGHFKIGFYYDESTGKIASFFPIL
jgi:hypothetical protein